MPSPSPSSCAPTLSHAARRRVGGWLGLAAVLLTVLVAAFGSLPLPSPTEGGAPFAMVICTADGLRLLDDGTLDGHGMGGVGHGLCLLCLPLGVDGVAAAAILLVVLSILSMPRAAVPLPVSRRVAAADGFGTARDVRGPPLRRV